MKKQLLLLSLACLSLGMSAKGVLITHTDGTDTFLSLESEMLVSFPNEQTIMFSREGQNDVELLLTDVCFFQIADDALGISQIQGEHVCLRVTDAGINVMGLLAGAAVKVVDAAGKLIKFSVSNAQGQVFIGTQGLHAGVYVLSLSNKKSYKILKK